MIVKASDWTRSRRKGREDMGMAWGSTLDGLFFVFLFLFWQGHQDIRVLRGDKCKTKPERWDKKQEKKTKTNTKNTQISQSRKVGDTENQLGRWAKEVTVCPPACPLSVLAVKTWLCLVLSLSGC